MDEDAEQDLCKAASLLGVRRSFNQDNRKKHNLETFLVDNWINGTNINISQLSSRHQSGTFPLQGFTGIHM